MQKFVTKIVDMMKLEKLYHTQGGPIILSQVTSKDMNKNLCSYSELGFLQINRSIKTH